MSPRRNVTGVLAAFGASSFDVCAAGKVAALHFSTTQGRVVIQVPLAVYRAVALSDRDSNGRPFSDPVRDVLVADAEAVPPAFAPAAESVQVPPRKARRTHEEAEALNVRVWAALELNPMQNVAELCAAHDAPQSSFSRWILVNKPGGLSALRGTDVHVMPTRPSATPPAPISQL